LESDHGRHPLNPGQRRQLFGFGGGSAQRPLGIDRFAGFESGPGRLIVRWDPYHHGHGIDLWRGHHGSEIVEGELRTERLAGFFGALGPGGADCGQFDIRAGQQRREVRLGGPGRAYVGAHKPQANLVCHAASSSAW
jgi:hypothetical protein